MMRKIILSGLLLSFLVFEAFAQTLTIGWSVSDVYVETGSSGNQAYVRLDWNDGNLGQTHGVSSWRFSITSTSITINTSSVALHSSIASNFNISKVNITGGVRVTIYGKSKSKMLKDGGGTTASYLVLTLTFTAPATDGDYTITLTNSSQATIRTTSPPYTVSTQTVTDGITTLNVHASTTPTDQAPVFTGTGYTNARKYGDINWDGFINVADVTALADVVIENYSAVQVQDPENSWYQGYRYFYETTQGESPIVYNNANIDNNDRTSADVYGSGGNPDNVLDLMDLAVLQDAVTDGAWPSYAITAIQGKPAYRISGGDNFAPGIFAKVSGGSKFDKVTADVFVNFEVFNAGQKSSKIRVSVKNGGSDLRGIQIEFNSSVLPGKLDVWRLPDASDLKLAWARNDFNRIVILLYADGGKVIKVGNRSYITIVIPNVSVEQLIGAEPRVIASISNLSYDVNFDIKQAGGILPLTYMLYQNYPNPFNPGTTVEFEVPEYSSVKLIVWNALGQKVKELYNGAVDPNKYQVYWDGKDEDGTPVASGVYFITMYARSLEENGKEFTMTRKALLMK